jgi:hypothetical protein
MEVEPRRDQVPQWGHEGKRRNTDRQQKQKEQGARDDPSHRSSTLEYGLEKR